MAPSTKSSTKHRHIPRGSIELLHNLVQTLQHLSEQPS
jgi:hypothetical protein